MSREPRKAATQPMRFASVASSILNMARRIAIVVSTMRPNEIWKNVRNLRSSRRCGRLATASAVVATARAATTMKNKRTETTGPSCCREHLTRVEPSWSRMWRPRMPFCRYRALPRTFHRCCRDLGCTLDERSMLRYASAASFSISHRNARISRRCLMRRRNNCNHGMFGSTPITTSLWQLWTTAATMDKVFCSMALAGRQQRPTSAERRKTE